MLEDFLTRGPVDFAFGWAIAWLYCHGGTSLEMEATVCASAREARSPPGEHVDALCVAFVEAAAGPPSAP